MDALRVTAEQIEAALAGDIDQLCEELAATKRYPRTVTARTRLRGLQEYVACRGSEVYNGRGD